MNRPSHFPSASTCFTLSVAFHSCVVALLIIGTVHHYQKPNHKGKVVFQKIQDQPQKTDPSVNLNQFLSRLPTHTKATLPTPSEQIQKTIQQPQSKQEPDQSTEQLSIEDKQPHSDPVTKTPSSNTQKTNPVNIQKEQNLQADPVKKTKNLSVITTENNSSFSINVKATQQHQKSETSKLNDQNDTTSDTQSARKRKLTLEDIFKKINSSGLQPLPANYTSNGTVTITEDDIRFYSFISQVLHHLQSSLSYHQDIGLLKNALASVKRNLQTRIITNNKGFVQEVQLLNSSGSNSMDAYIKERILLASPLPPLPASLGDKLFNIQITFVLTPS